MIFKTVDSNDRDFIVRMLYKDSYEFFTAFCDIFTSACFYAFNHIYCSVAYVNC